MIFLSLKTYKQSSGDNLIQLAKIAEKVQQDTQVPIILCAQPFDIYRLKQTVKLEVWAQHLDPIDPGRHFGWLSPYSAKLAGASGTVINHAEHAVDFKTIKATVAKCRQYQLKTLVISDSFALAEKVNTLKPDYLAFEYPKLIGGKLAMIEADPAMVKKVIAIASVPVIVGAGIQTGAHAQKTVKLGGAGVILASAVVKAQDQEAALRDLASGFN